MTSLFHCPLCQEPLERVSGAYRCPTGHSYDIAKEGYTYLLPVNQRHSLSPGDDKAMSTARRAFLSRDWYRPLADALCRLCVENTPNTPTVLDAGCGEGYYTQRIWEALQAAGKMPHMAGIDISKPILRYAAKRTQEVEFAVASCYHLPVADGCVDLLLNCFSPLAVEEFRRVLRPDGFFLYVVPAAQHLWELKQVLYDRPYPNEEKIVTYPGFTTPEIFPVDARLHLTDPADIRNLFGMTPYCWKTPRDGVERLDALTELSVQISFRIHLFRKV